MPLAKGERAGKRIDGLTEFHPTPARRRKLAKPPAIELEQQHDFVTGIAFAAQREYGAQIAPGRAVADALPVGKQEQPIGQGHIDDDGVAGMLIEGRENACIECLEQTHGSLLFPAQPAKLADLVNDVVKRRTSAFASAAPKPTEPQATKEPANETCPTRRDLPDHGQGQ